MLCYLGSSVIYSVFMEYEYTIKTYATSWFSPNDRAVNLAEAEFSFGREEEREKEKQCCKQKLNAQKRNA